MKELVTFPHSQGFAQVAKTLQTDLTAGLDRTQRKKRLELYGPNLLPQEKKIGRFDLLLRQLESPLVIILLVAALITSVLREWPDTIVILASVIFDVVLGFLQEGKAQEAVLALKRMSAPQARVIREGIEQRVEAASLVPGDILVFEQGDQLTADARLFEVNQLSLDESILSGESLPVNKQVDPVREISVPADQKSMAFAGANVVRGRGKGIVVKTGVRTQMGQIAHFVRESEDVQTPLQRNLTRFSFYLSVVIVGIASLTFLVGLSMGEEMLSMFLFAVALAVSAIPEGLVIELTVALAVGMQHMAKRSAIVRTLPAVEGLGAVTVICVDKTGTLTLNKLKVTEIASDDIDKLIWVAILCNNAQFVNGETLGDPLEGALLEMAQRYNFDYQEIRQQHPRQLEIPFSEEKRLMATLNSGFKGSSYLFLKGAPKEVINLCKLPRPERERQLLIARRLASLGLKPLALAYQKVGQGFKMSPSADLPPFFSLAGLTGIEDPLRDEVSEAVSRVQAAGVRVIMLTGDHRLTAASIAKKAGIKNADQVLKGSDLREMNKTQLREALKEVAVFARVTPEDKLEIVKSLQGVGEVVAMTGDGVNDAPALTTADIGIAMGQGGTDVARASSDIVLKDNNFTTIVAAIEWGRSIFENLKKVVLYLISTNTGEVLTVLGSFLVRLPLPLYPTQILWLNLVTDGLPDNALIFEPKDEDVMQKPPRHPSESLLSRLSLLRSGLMGLTMAILSLWLFSAFLPQGLEKARSVALSLMAVFQIFNAFNMQSETLSLFKTGFLRNIYLTGAVFLSFLFQVAVVEVGFLQRMFRTVPLTFQEWALIVVLAMSIIGVEELRKLVFRRSELKLG